MAQGCCRRRAGGSVGACCWLRRVRALQTRPSSASCVCAGSPPAGTRRPGGRRGTGRDGELGDGWELVGGAGFTSVC